MSIKLSELKNDEMLLVGDNGYAISKELYVRELELWGEYQEGDVYTTIEIKANINARDMLESALEQEEVNNMYEGWMDDVLFNVTDYDITLLQTIIDNIISRTNRSAYIADKKVEVDV